MTDSFKERATFRVLTSFGPVWRTINTIKCCRRRANRFLTNNLIKAAPIRPDPWSTFAPYTSWEGLTNKAYWKLHLPPRAEPARDLMPVEKVADLFLRPPGQSGKISSKSTVLFTHFASWFTDGFLRSDRTEPRDLRKNACSHEIDLCQLYGYDNDALNALRSHKRGRMDSQTIHGEEYPPYLCLGGKIKPEYEVLPLPAGWKMIHESLKGDLFAFGSDRANFSHGYAMLTVLFLREHNRVADLLAAENPSWDDERIFQTTRMIMIVLEIKLVVNEYINHITPYNFLFDADPFMLTGKEEWLRPPWMSLEFNLLYRWHCLVPSKIHVGDHDVPLAESLFHMRWLPEHGLGQLFEDASQQHATKLGLFNTDAALRFVEIASISSCRAGNLRPYNEYREMIGMKRFTEFDQINTDPEVVKALKSVYKSVDDIEFYVGLFSETVRENSVLPSGLSRLVAIDAFSQVYCNPLFAKRIWNEQTFSKLGKFFGRDSKPKRAGKGGEELDGLFPF
eukprot:TRINITY_DN8073_c0_g3_i1.p1 TRINITY_DN8073_c0_g3~~TRINITY_DN8073_c0_g3_i1.p1  ORF type:complete len:548 (+),score=67.82 TRINITY_DN8073_c0_g3_i1:123-1646(+)